MAGNFSMSFSQVAITADQELFTLHVATGKTIWLVGLHLSGSGIAADAGDAKEQILPIEIRRGFTTVGSGGSDAPPVNLHPDEAADALTAHRVNDTTLASGGTNKLVFADGWNIRAPYIWIPTPEMQIGCTAGVHVVRMALDPAESVTCSGTLFFIEP